MYNTIIPSLTLSAQQVAEINCRAIRKAGISLQMRYPIDTSFFCRCP